MQYRHTGTTSTYYIQSAGIGIKPSHHDKVPAVGDGWAEGRGGTGTGSVRDVKGKQKIMEQ